MNKKALQVLEYNKIKELLGEECGCEMSRGMAKALSPGGDIRDITDELRSTTEAVDLIVRKGALPTEGIHDLKGTAGIARKGGCLSMKNLIAVAHDLRVAVRVLSFLKGDVPEMPHVMALAELIVPHQELSDDIDRCILSEDEMSDDASPELRRIRRAIIRQNETIRARLAHMVNSQSNQSYLQDSIVTIRDGRYVIPVKQEHRSEFPGIVHDQSKGGATLFIEPQIVVELNNELKELMLSEEAEIARILQELSDRVGSCYHDICNNQDLITKLDFIMARGKLSCRMRGEEPSLNEDGVLKLRSARHPLLDQDKAVPITVELGDHIDHPYKGSQDGPGYTTLVVTGPNTGGKTVTLKTCGLLTLMALSGLHIPASSQSTIPVYEDVFADIGDEQSIEQSLSTFSSHMKNIVYIVGRARPDVLILLDELGAGTDPTEGAALGVAILEKLHNAGAHVIATTHYNEIKKYALSTDGVENASMEFNVETLSPTYRLLTGVPGKSNAFEISRKLGLSGKIIGRAENLIEKGDLAFENVITRIEKDRFDAEHDREEAGMLRAEMEEAHRKFKEEERSFNEKKEQMMRDARREAREIIREAGETADEVKRELRELSHEESLGERNRRFSESRHKLNEKEKQYQERVIGQVNDAPVNVEDLKIGDTVMYVPLGQEGTIVTLPDDKGSLTISVGSMKMKVSAADLTVVRHSRKQQTRSRASVTGLMRSKAMSIKMEKDVRGENLDDALMEVTKYIDDAAMARLETCVIIHGRGEGILRDGIRRELKKNKHVASFRPGEYNEGGEGVTVVTLKR
ncbi:MAG: endonuclease MutS2 [Eubacterium sp.]|nr:endonuclease MutS2 [Eubacterium sp.]